MRQKLTITLSCEGASLDRLTYKIKSYILKEINNGKRSGTFSVLNTSLTTFKTSVNEGHWTANYREVASYRKKGIIKFL